MKEYKKYLILVNYKTDGWGIVEQCDDWNVAVRIRDIFLSYGNQEIIIVEYCPLIVLDGRNRN